MSQFKHAVPLWLVHFASGLSGAANAVPSCHLADDLELHSGHGGFFEQRAV
ncbi:hypothetical protein OSW16_26690 [Pseudomonas putida]|uniref:hypothetical protein n=1 Tax=Pseudomonas putida TaxID=303 RepID=UPI00226DBCCD|nr:hypothetical protein [Pseudomonas putida]WAB98039.1 hypothetical protein OSW16_26690 [Pseudomonas putida]